jgi:hypothetical protein
LSCSASGISTICCDLTRPTITRLARTFRSTRTRRRREQYVPLVAFCLRHFLADFIMCMCVFDFRQAQGSKRRAFIRLPKFPAADRHWPSKLRRGERNFWMQRREAKIGLRDPKRILSRSRRAIYDGLQFRQRSSVEPLGS